mmetsp:Transcript_6059/g.12159  ORF Transcript_6059/g.12159 Transcript_6059/m.12159 type:complete len:172 (-) Transcript_6059:99-614(-)|eukprot:scaffold3576_cov170-Amphora_coffeaeformis.AAC.24
MYSTKRFLDVGSPPPSKRPRCVSYSDNRDASVLLRCEHSAEECRRLLQYKDTMAEALDALLQHRELLMQYARINGAHFYLTYALAHATKDAPQLCAKIFRVMWLLLALTPEDTAHALRASGATTHVQQAIHRHPHHLLAHGNELLQALGSTSRRVTLDASSLRSNAIAVSW